MRQFFARNVVLPTASIRNAFSVCYKFSVVICWRSLIIKIDMRVYERDTDVIFLRALREIPQFIAILGRVAAGEQSIEILDVRGQVRHAGGRGSIDIVVRCRDGLIFLVENKIDATYSVTRDGRSQPERYRQSANIFRMSGSRAFSILLAPSIYISGSRLSDVFDDRVSYEALSHLLSDEDRKIVDLAILQAATPYEPVENIGTSQFFLGVRRLVERQFPDLVMKHDPNEDGIRPHGSHTIYFDVARTLAPHEGVLRPKMSHQCWDSGARSPSVKIMLPNRAALANRLTAPVSLVDIGGYLRPASGSLGIVIDTPRLDTQKSVADQADDLVEALQAALRLQLWWKESGPVLRDWSAEHPTAP